MVDRLARMRAATGGPFTRAQALAAGISESEMRRMLRRGTCASLRRGVYVEKGVRANAMRDGRRAHALEVAALRLGLDCDVVAGGTSAARIIWLETLDGSRELTVLTADDARRCRQRHGYVLRVVSLPPHHREHRFGVPVTSTARTVVDIARWGTLTEGVVVADSALRQRAVTARQLASRSSSATTTAPGARR